MEGHRLIGSECEGHVNLLLRKYVGAAQKAAYFLLACKIGQH